MSSENVLHSYYKELVNAEKKHNMQNVVTIDLTRYLYAVRHPSGSFNVSHWSVARQRMYDHTLRQLEVPKSAENPLSDALFLGLAIFGAAAVAGLIYNYTTKPAAAVNVNYTPSSGNHSVTIPIGGTLTFVSVPSGWGANNATPAGIVTVLNDAQLKAVTAGTTTILWSDTNGTQTDSLNVIVQ